MKTKNESFAFVVVMKLLISSLFFSGLVYANNGTSLSASSTVGKIVCSNEKEAMVEIITNIKSTGAVDSAEIHQIINDGQDFISGWITPQDFIHQGRDKLAVSSYSQIFENGTYNVKSCYIQSGAQGRQSKSTCSAAVSFVVKCAKDPSPCAKTLAFGNIIGNGNLCSGQAMPVHFKGDFGSSASLEIAKGDFKVVVPVHRAGDSCVYQGKYLPNSGHAGEGVYSFALTGDNNNTFSFTAQLKCR